MSSTSRPVVAVVFGGRSTEHEISVITGLEIINAMDTTRYQTLPVYIDQRGRWFTGPQLLNKSFYKGVPNVLDKLKEVTLLPVPRTGGLTLINNKKGFSLFGGSKSEIIPVDVFIPAFHGQFGEDGCIQGLFEMADVVYTGCGVPASAIAMNKQLCKSALSAHGIPVLPGTTVPKSEAQKNLAVARQRVRSTKGLENFPLFVKPMSLGSSIGVSKAENESALDAALAKVFQYDIEAIVEPCIVEKLEVNVSVRLAEGNIIASVTETPVASDETLTYEDKYLRGGKGKKGKAQASPGAQGMASLTRVIDPETLPDSVKSAVIAHATTAYRVLGCSGIVRFDFMIDLTKDALYFNELNPLPGSMAHYLWEKSKPPVLYPEMLHDMIQSSITRQEQKAGLQKDVGFRAMFG